MIFRVLSNLLVLEGERLSYRTLDVEQIGSVYEAMMGFNLEVAAGRSIAIKPKKAHGAPATINLEALLAAKPADRAKWLKEQSEQTLAGQALTALKEATTLEELLVALDRKIDHRVTPQVVPKGAMALQPSDERRRSGSHYTPRSLTEPIVRTTLGKLSVVSCQLSEEKLSVVSCQLSEEEEDANAARNRQLTLDNRQPTLTPDQILNLKICDLAMGSGAFLVEACRQLGDELVRAWHVYDCVPKLPPDEDEVLHARRLVAQRCLYGVDKNPMAVDLAKLSLWLATLAKDHPFTFLDHALRSGDSLVGLSREQIAGFHWDDEEIEKHQTDSRASLLRDPIAECVERATAYRQQILAARDDNPYDDLQQKLEVADDALSLARLSGDLVVSAYFSAAKDRDRKAKLEELGRQLVAYVESRDALLRRPLTEAVAELRGKVAGAGYPVPATMPFHWQIEFPEVFARPNGGFDAIVGNPPFAGKNTLIAGNRAGYLDWLKTVHDESHGNADLVAHFFRRAFNLLRPGGTFGLIATNTIGQGDTRSTGLRWICTHGGVIYSARKRYKWPGLAAVVVSVVHISKGPLPPPYLLDGRAAPIITAYLFHAGGHDDPEKLKANEGKSFKGSEVYGMGFTFDDGGGAEGLSSIVDMEKIIQHDARNSERIFPFLGGEEINESPSCSFRRYAIYFGIIELAEAENWPDLMQIVREKVKPQRDALPSNQSSRSRREKWWQWSRPTPELYAAIRHLSRVLVIAQTSDTMAFAFSPSAITFAHTVVVFPLRSYAAFAVLQGNAHRTWALLFGATMKDDARYIPTDCFETFPFPAGVLEAASSAAPATDNRQLTTDNSPSTDNRQLTTDNSPTTDNRQLTTDNSLDRAGRDYYDFRAALMIRNNEGLTKTYNRFHDPCETSADILKLRELHAAMDKAVLEAYGWHDLADRARCDFLLDYEDDEDDEEPATPGRRQRKKPWRYRWPDEFRDEVLARLLALNAERAEAERLTGAAQAAKAKAKRVSRKKKPPDAKQSELLE